MTTLFSKSSNLSLRNILTHKKLLEVMVLLFTILLSGFLGNFVALLATWQITNVLTRFIVGIIVGLLVGICVGILVKRTWEKIQHYFLKAQSQ